MQALVRVMHHHEHGSRPCPLCDCSRWSQDSLLGHLLALHTDSLGLVEAGSVEEVISSAADLLQLMKYIIFSVNLLLYMYGCAPGGGGACLIWTIDYSNVCTSCRTNSKPRPFIMRVTQARQAKIESVVVMINSVN